MSGDGKGQREGIREDVEARRPGRSFLLGAHRGGSLPRMTGVYRKRLYADLWDLERRSLHLTARICLARGLAPRSWSIKTTLIWVERSFYPTNLRRAFLFWGGLVFVLVWKKPASVPESRLDPHVGWSNHGYHYQCLIAQIH